MSARDLSESQTTFPSDSENYDANHSNSNDSSDEPRSDSSSPMILYQPPTFWSLIRGAAINLFLPFVNGLMLGFGELFAHEAAFRLGWSNTKVFPSHRSDHRIGPGVEIREDPIERRRRDGEEMDAYTSLE
ncbi:Mitochondrial import 1 [Lecanosticta acicola]|uniref:Mitochondrial import 1 n=1 Tax=Lecanosticta acicola TaxID=111012 RepID=A0AAI8YW77_9PEZI|nr:Mitochondrial import 1 [Lecanosticta acicola]